MILLVFSKTFQDKQILELSANDAEGLRLSKSGKEVVSIIFFVVMFLRFKFDLHVYFDFDSL